METDWSARHVTIQIVWTLVSICMISAVMWISTAVALADAGSIKGTVRATTRAANTSPVPLPGAHLTLVNRDLPAQSMETITDAAGNFIFPDLPAATYILTVDAVGLPSATREILLTKGAIRIVEIELAATIKETVVVREEEGLLSTAETATSNIIHSDTLKEVPLRAENYQSSMLLTPGVVRGTDGRDYMKGARAGQSAYTINGVDITDPVTGNLAFDIPLEAASIVQIEENPYSAEFGRLTGGAINLDTKGGGDNFNFTAARFFPAFRGFISGKVDSFRPRVTVSGPVIRKRLFFLQSFEYRFTRAFVPSLPQPRDEITSENVNSFTQLDLIINKSNRVRVAVAFFPQRLRFATLNTFNPQETTPNVKQRGSLFSVSEQAIFRDGSFLDSNVSYKSFDVDVFAQGPLPLTLLPDGNQGNYFADARRRAPRFQWQETYYARPLAWNGQHSFKFGIEVYHTAASGQFLNNSILIRRRNNTLAQHIDFAGTGLARRTVGEFAAFVHDRWMVNSRLTIDAGVRLDRDGLARQSNVAPRFSLLLLPFKSKLTVLRAGIGLFYDRIPLAAGYFPQLQERIVTTFAPDGLTITDGPRRFNNTIEGPMRDPRSLRWSLQLDQGITKNLIARIGYLSRSTRNDLIIEPRVGATSALVLSSNGRAHYNEFQLIGIYNTAGHGYLTASYVHSTARGDLNTVDRFLGNFPEFVVRPNEYRPLPFDAPHRFLLYGQLKMRYGINISPSLEIRSGFPFSFVNEQLDFVGPRNLAGRFPTFLSLDIQATKAFALPASLIPKSLRSKLEGRKIRVGAAVFNVTNHFNPRDVQNNLGSPRAGQFFNSLGTSVRGKLEMDF
jgi:hypothetical protein